MLCRKGRKIMLYVETRDKHIYAHNFLNIQPIFNPQKVLESWDLDLSKNTIQCYVCRRGRKLFRLSTPSTCFDNNSIPLTEKNHFSKTFQFFQRTSKTLECIYLNLTTSKVPPQKCAFQGPLWQVFVMCPETYRLRTVITEKRLVYGILMPLQSVCAILYILGFLHTDKIACETEFYVSWRFVLMNNWNSSVLICTGCRFRSFFWQCEWALRSTYMNICKG